ncbi:hypothetical protein AGMMS4952_16770 [Spirochaetia bacterium]|nr:hypothetical protein AGMMS4952_16770 [Spirochaetia bacterium]
MVINAAGAMIQLTNVTKTFGEKGQPIVQAVKDVSFTVDEGEIFGVIGFSGGYFPDCVNPPPLFLYPSVYRSY